MCNGFITYHHSQSIPFISGSVYLLPNKHNPSDVKDCRCFPHSFDGNHQGGEKDSIFLGMGGSKDWDVVVVEANTR